MRDCPVCGASNAPTEDFCHNCGSYLGWSDEAPTPGRGGADGPAGPARTEPGAPAGSGDGSTAAPPRTGSGTRAGSGSAVPPDAAPGCTVPARGTTEADERAPQAGTGGRTAPPQEGSGASARRGTTVPTDGTSPDVDGPAAGTASTVTNAVGRTASTPPHAAPGTAAPGSGSGSGSGSAQGAGQHAPTAGQAVTGTVESATVTPSTRQPSSAPPPPRRPTPPPAPAAVEEGAPGPVLPGKAAAARPVVRQVPVDEDTAGAPCPVCGTPNAPGRNFCRKCAAPLTPTAAPEPLPWWRTVWPFRRRIRGGSGRFTRFLTVLVVVLALCAGGFLLLPAGRALIEDTRDKLGKAKPVTPTGVRASADLPGHAATATTDGLSNRYWGAPRSGASVTYGFARPFRMVDVIVTNGASDDPQAYALQGRALRIEMEVTSKDGTVVRETLNLSDKAGPQTFQTGISEVTTVRMVLESPAGLSGGRHLAVAEVEFFQRG